MLHLHFFLFSIETPSYELYCSDSFQGISSRHELILGLAIAAINGKNRAIFSALRVLITIVLLSLDIVKRSVRQIT